MSEYTKKHGGYQPDPELETKMHANPPCGKVTTCLTCEGEGLVWMPTGIGASQESHELCPTCHGIGKQATTPTDDTDAALVRMGIGNTDGRSIAAMNLRQAAERAFDRILARLAAAERPATDDAVRVPREVLEAIVAVNSTDSTRELSQPTSCASTGGVN